MSEVEFLARDEIEKRAADILRQHGLLAVPVNPVTLANRLGIRVNNAKFSDSGMVGMIARRGVVSTILVNYDDPPYRKRFTISHELGHHFLHLHRDGEFTDHEANLFRSQEDPGEPIDDERRREIQANMFAAALLMPEPLVREKWALLRSSTSMARLFNVSEEAMGYRLERLRLI